MRSTQFGSASSVRVVAFGMLTLTGGCDLGGEVNTVVPQQEAPRAETRVKSVEAPETAFAWRASEEDRIDSNPAVADDGMIVFAVSRETASSNRAGALVALHPTGDLRWRAVMPSFKEWASFAPSIDSKGNTYVLYETSGSNTQERVLANVASNGLVRWSKPVDGFVGSPAAVRGDGAAFVSATLQGPGKKAPHVHGFSQFGDELWTQKLPVADLCAAPILDGNENLVVRCLTDLFSLDSGTGKIRWHKQFEYALNAGPVADADGNVVVVMGNNAIILDADSGSVKAQGSGLGQHVDAIIMPEPTRIVGSRQVGGTSELCSYGLDASLDCIEVEEFRARGYSIVPGAGLFAVNTGNGDGAFFRLVEPAKDVEVATRMSSGREPERFKKGTLTAIAQGGLTLWQNGRYIKPRGSVSGTGQLGVEAHKASFGGLHPAPWPKPFHDARNTNNATTPIAVELPKPWQKCDLPDSKQNQNAMRLCSKYDLVCHLDERGHIVRMEVELDGDDAADEVRVMEYDGCGNLLSKEISRVDGAPMTAIESGISGSHLRTNYEYDDRGNFTQETVLYGEKRDRVTRWEYNEAGHATSMFIDRNGDGKEDMEWTYEPDGEGRPTKRECKKLTKKGKCPK